MANAQSSADAERQEREQINHLLGYLDSLTKSSFLEAIAKTAPEVFPQGPEVFYQFWYQEKTDHDRRIHDVLEAISECPDFRLRMRARKALVEIVREILFFGQSAGSVEIEAKRKQRVKDIIALALEAKRNLSQLNDAAIVELASPIWTRHPRYTSNRIATDIRDKLNKQLVARGQKALTHGAIRKRIAKLRKGRFA